MEFKSRRGDVLNLFFFKEKKDHLLRATGEGNAQFDASRLGKKELKSSRDKNATHEP